MNIFHSIEIDEEAILNNTYLTFVVTFLFFFVLYFGTVLFAIVFKNILRAFSIGAPIIGKPSNVTVVKEIQRSMFSILIFSLQAIPLQLLFKYGLIKISKDTSMLYWGEVLFLFLWNEAHFYFTHRLLHTKWLFKRVHHIHHLSYTPTPFSSYSFHWAEALLLGFVIYLPILFYPFYLSSIILLPVLSILLNVIGHWSYDVFPNIVGQNNILKFTIRHSLHHKYVKGNYGFLLPVFDAIFRTKIITTQHKSDGSIH
jgi:lathosterol oxidase